MKLLLVLCFVVVSFFCFGQGMKGYTVKEIKQEFTEAETVSEKYLDNGDYCLYLNHSLVWTFYYFKDKYGECYTTIVVPKDDYALNWYVKYYNDNYVIKDEYNWVRYEENYIIHVNLSYYNDELPVFIID